MNWPSTTESVADVTGEMDARAVRYSALITRWYPRSWRETHGDVLLGTMLDVAESESLARPTVAQQLDIVSNGLRQHFREAATVAPSRIVSSVATGSLITVVAVFFLAHLPRPWFADESTHVAVSGLFLAGWLLVSAFLMLHRRGASVAALLLAVGLTVWSAPAWSGDWPGRVTHLEGVVILVKNFLPTVAGNLTLLLALSAIGISHRPEPRMTALSAAATTPFALLLAATSASASLFGSFGSYGALGAHGPFVVPAAALAAILVALVLARAGRSPAAKIVLACTVPWLAAWTVALFTSPIPVVYMA